MATGAAEVAATVPRAVVNQAGVRNHLPPHRRKAARAPPLEVRNSPSVQALALPDVPPQRTPTVAASPLLCHLALHSLEDKPAEEQGTKYMAPRSMVAVIHTVHLAATWTTGLSLMSFGRYLLRHTTMGVIRMPNTMERSDQEAI